jgi:predicted nuclease of predicted toxin-antitoxin system
VGGPPLEETGPGNAPDTELLKWARENEHVIVTQDLDFSQLLHATQHTGPSVVLLRLDNEFDPAVQKHVCAAIELASQALETGALLTISPGRVRLRHLSIGS